MKNIVYILICSALFLSACSKDKEVTDDEMMQEEDELLLLKNVLKNGVVYDMYEYDDAQRLSKARVHIGNNGIEYFLITYNEDRVITRAYRAGDLLSYTHDLYPLNSHSYRFDWVYEKSPPNPNFYILVDYSPEGCGINNQIQYYTADDSVKQTRYFEYQGANCNDTEEYTAEDGTLSTYVRTRDEYVNAFSSIFPQESFAIPKHNIIAETRYRENGEVIEQQSFTSTYEYNNIGYPTSEVRTYLSGIVDNYTYDYY